MTNVQRSVERVDGVEKVAFDLNTGRGLVRFQPGREPNPADLWEAIERSGFTPVRIEFADTVYEGP